jgi:glucosyl-3-phosphoglycerate synthase
VTELMARPLLNLHVSQLAGFEQPLAGEFAARRALLEALPFPAGYGVEVALLIDALRAAGLDALAEVRLGTRQNDHQPLRELGAMAYAVLCAVEARIGDGRAVPAGLVQPWAGGAVRDVALIERPPLAQLRAARNAGIVGALS